MDDIRTRLIREWQIRTLLLLGIVHMVFLLWKKEEPKELLAYFLCGGLMMLMGMLLQFCSGQQFGMGDVKVIALLGLQVTFIPLLLTLLYAFVFCALFSLLGIVLKKFHRNTSLPFIPFLMIGFLLENGFTLW